jgi:putative ABC transport system permease protein
MVIRIWRCILLGAIRHTLRSLRHSPGFSLFAIITLALGIGCNTAVFSVADAFLFKPLAFREPDRLVMLHERAPGNSTLQSAVSLADLVDFRRRSTSYDEIAAFQQVDLNLSNTGEPETVYSTMVSPNFFDTLGVKPRLGRALAPGEDMPGRNQVAVLSFGLWQRRFAGDPQVIGRQIHLNGSSYSIVGVMPKSMRFPIGSELWAPLAMTPGYEGLRDQRYTRLVARLKRGVSESRARAELQTIAALLSKTYPRTNRGWGVIVQPLDRYVIGDLNRQFSMLLLGAVGFVLLIACANVMSLQFARVSGRQKEFAIRTALGASRWRVTREVIGESVLLSLAAAGLSLFFSGWTISAILSNMPSDVARYIGGWDEIRLDGRALLFTMAVATLAGLVSGLLPAIRMAPDVNNALKQGARGASAGRGRLRSRTALVIGQIAAAMILLAGAGLILKGSETLLHVNNELDPESVLTMQVVLSDEHYSKPSQRAAFFDGALDRLGALPGVESAALVSNPPYGSNVTTTAYEVEGQPAANSADLGRAQLEVVSPTYMETLRLQMMEGRALRDSDRAGAPEVAIISESLARRHWPNKAAIGRHFRIDKRGPWLTVVGVVKDVRYDPWSTEVAPVIYRPYRQAPVYYTYLLLRAHNDPLSLALAARHVIAGLDIDRPLWELKTLDRVIAGKLIGLSYVSAMLAVLGAIALVLSAAGIYGLMAYTVSERTREIGIRIALGAARGEILRMLVRRGVQLTLAGLAIGLAISIPLARLLASLIYGVRANDLLAFSGAALLLATVALLACYVPARGALLVDPVDALRQE